MPIHKMTLEGEVFATKAVGYFDNMDTRLWVNTLSNHASSHLLPIAVMIDMAEVTRLCPTVTKILAEALKNSNIKGVAVVISDSMASQNMRVIDKLDEIPGVRVFSSHDEALCFSKARLTAPALSGSWGGVTVSSFSFAGSY